MQRLLEWIDRHLTLVCFAACTGIVVAFALAYQGGAVYAAPAAKASEPVPDCVAIGKSGPLVVSRCVDDESGDTLYVNNYGFMVLEQ